MTYTYILGNLKNSQSVAKFLFIKFRPGYSTGMGKMNLTDMGYRIAE